MILSLDFDDTIMNPQDVPQGKKMGNPMEGAVETINALYRRGNTIIVHTVRGARPKHVEDWLDYYGIKYHEVTDKKPKADWYIDDKALPFISWNQVFNAVKGNK